MGKVNKELLVKLLCELLASMFVEFIGCSMPGLVGLPYALSWGAGVLASTQAFRIVSGAHINPCISIASMILQNVEILDGFLYILMQLIGSALGFGVAYGLYYNKGLTNTFCVTMVRINPWWKSILLEFYMTGAWVFAMCASWHTSNEKQLESISLRIGLVVVAATLVGSEATGAAMNPFRSLWPAIAAQYWDYIWIFLVIPPVTAALLGVCWRFLYLQGNDESKAEE